MPKIKLSKNFIINVCKLALNEDLYPLGDITSNLLRNNTKKRAKLLSNQSGIIGGLEFAKQTFKLIETTGQRVQTIWKMALEKRINFNDIVSEITRSQIATNRFKLETHDIGVNTYKA